MFPSCIGLIQWKRYPRDRFLLRFNAVWLRCPQPVATKVAAHIQMLEDNWSLLADLLDFGMAMVDGAYVGMPMYDDCTHVT